MNYELQMKDTPPPQEKKISKKHPKIMLSIIEHLADS